MERNGLMDRLLFTDTRSSLNVDIWGRYPILISDRCIPSFGWPVAAAERHPKHYVSVMLSTVDLPPPPSCSYSVNLGEAVCVQFHRKESSAAQRRSRAVKIRQAAEAETPLWPSRGWIAPLPPCQIRVANRKDPRYIYTDLTDQPYSSS